MSKTVQSTRSAGLGLGGAMFLLFLGLRLTDNIDWAWYWVAAPLWIPALLALVIVVPMAIWVTRSDR